MAEPPITKEIAYLIIDGAYFKVRRKRVGTEAALCALGITEDGQREHLGFGQGQRELTVIIKGVCSIKWVTCKPNALKYNGR